MNPEMPQQPQDESDVQLTALLLGELPHQQAAALHQKLAQDAELAKLYERLKQTINLVRETLATPAAQTADHPTPLKLSDQRREKLLQHFKTIRQRNSSHRAAAGCRGLSRWGCGGFCGDSGRAAPAGLLESEISRAESYVGTLSLSEPAASAQLAPPVQNSTRSYQGSIRRLISRHWGRNSPARARLLRQLFKKPLHRPNLPARPSFCLRPRSWPMRPRLPPQKVCDLDSLWPERAEASMMIP